MIPNGHYGPIYNKTEDAELTGNRLLLFVLQPVIINNHITPSSDMNNTITTTAASASLLDLLKARSASINPINQAIVGGARPTHKLFGILGTGVSTNNGLWSDQNAVIKQHVVNEAPDDILAASVCWARLRSVLPHMPDIDSLISRALFDSIIDEDRIKANLIRDHYKQKSIVWSLTEKKLTKFRQDLLTFVNLADGKFYMDDLLPLAYRLPEMFQYDIEFVEMKSNFSAPSKTLAARSGEVTLTPVRSFDRKMKSGKKHEYWLKNRNSLPFLLMVDPSDTCKSLWDREFKLSEIKLYGHQMIPYERDGLACYKITKWSIA